MSEEMRIDKWLWVARFFKSRALAVEAVNGGKVHINGSRVKPSRPVKVADQVEITRGQFHTEVTVLGMAKQRRPACEAQALYQESQESTKRREEQLEQWRLERMGSGEAAQRRPTKKDRRQIHRFRNQNS